MTGMFSATILALAVIGASAPVDTPPTSPVRLPVPESKRLDLVETLHGIRVADPYRWLEDGNSEETRRWIEEQNKVTFAYLRSLPGRQEIHDRLTHLWNFPRYGLPFERGGRYFFTRNDGLQQHSVWYVAESLDGEPRVLLDPNTLSEDGRVAVSSVSISWDGKLAAYAISVGGSDWLEWRVRNVDTGEDLPDRIRWSKFSGASWSKDNAGFYYSRYDEPEPGEKLQGQNFFQKVYYHRIGTPQEENVRIYERPDQPRWGFGVWVTEDGHYLMYGVWDGTQRENRIFYKDLTKPDAEVVELLPHADARYDFLGNIGARFFFRTDRDAPKGRIIAIDLDKPDPENWTTIVPESENALASASLVGGHFFLTYLYNAHSQVLKYTTDGKLVREIPLPGLGSVGGFGGRMDSKETFFSYTSFAYPTTLFRYDIESGEITVHRKSEVDFDPEKFETKQVWFVSKDGTRVPMFVTHKKGIELDGSNPTILYGYGGFSAAQTPFFSIVNQTWMEMGGVYALANIRGGNEFGREWYEAGRVLNRQNVFDDFIAAAEFLIEAGYTSPQRLAIQGGSNGGLLVGAAMTQRPDLFAVALPAVGVLDMLRFHKFTIGWAWTSDYGNPEVEEEFKKLLSYSPLHNLKPGTAYPATLITTGDHDDRVVPAHSFKFAAALQHAQGGDRPVLIRIETRAGHGAGKPTQAVIDERADILAFTLYNTGGRLPAGFGR